MNPDSCALYQNCECPSCPLEVDSNQVWYSEDEICKNPDFHIINNSMKKLKKKGAPGYFILQILNRDFIVRKGIEGIDPDLPDSIKDPLKEYQKKEKTWLRRHPEISVERREAMRALGLKSIQSIQKPLSHPSISEILNPKGMITSLSPQSPQKSVESGGIEK
ncbi:MAG: hypothetical protein M0Z77_08060 [Thermoplasmatales archaeon]|nr:hypothetical protein [Thermoplasmatales archaeon]